MTTLEAGNALKVATGLPQGSLDYLSETANKLYFVLSAVAQKVKEARGYHPNTTQVTFFCPVEVVALSVGCCRKTVYNRLPELVSSGLVEQRGHYCTHNGRTRLDGSLWAVRLSPDMPGRAKIGYDWLKKQGYRNLGADIEAGRTAFALTQSNLREQRSLNIEYILSFALPPTSSNPLSNDCVTSISSKETLLDLAYVPLEGRNKAVDSTAKAIATSLGSPTGSLMFWRWLLWQLLRLEQLEKSYFYQVYLIVQRAEVERRENACKNAAGLAVSWLKKSPIWDELKSVSPMRIGRKPPDLAG